MDHTCQTAVNWQIFESRHTRFEKAYDYLKEAGASRETSLRLSTGTDVSVQSVQLVRKQLNDFVTVFLDKKQRKIGCYVPNGLSRAHA